MQAGEGAGRPQRDVPALMGRATHTLAFYTLIVVVAEAGLFAAVLLTEGLDRTLLIAGMILILLAVVVVAGIKFVRPPGSEAFGEMPTEIRPLGSPEKQEITEEIAKAWEGRWNCQWTYRTKSGTLQPYVDDQMVIEHVDRGRAAIHGYGISSQVQGARYSISGRVDAKGHLAQLIYSSPPPLIRLAGLFILALTPTGDLSGWWLGVGADGGDVGGGITCVRAHKDPDFVPRNYAAPSHPGLHPPLSS